jgi:pyruvate formate lyase activating enzyme
VTSKLYNSDLDLEGLVFDIQRFSLHDGGGIRTLVFMKGCPLRCEWCSNPESQSSKPEVMFFEERCIGCGECIEACPFDTQEEIWPIDTDVCIGCGKCVEHCYSEAKQMVGTWYSVKDVLDIILKDRVFYEESGGGVTVGGGEPTNQPRFVAALLEACRSEGIHTAVETCGYAVWETMEKVLDHVDLLLFDIKHMDPKLHKEKTGVTNQRILDNARRAARKVKKMIVRLPFIPGFNDSDENLHGLGRFIRDELDGVERLDLLPYHSTGESKNRRRGKEYPFHPGKEQAREDIDRGKSILQSYGLKVKIGG